MAELSSNTGFEPDSEPGLLGVEIGRSKVRLVLMDREGRSIHDAVEQLIAKAGGPRDPIEEEYSTRSAIEAGLARLRIDQVGTVLVGATIGFANCGVGSGPAIRDWLGSLSDEIGEPLVYTGDNGVSYAPASGVDFVRRVFDPIELHLDRVELAPVAAGRCLGPIQSGAMTLGSGVAWSARILNGHVLEAFETIDGSVDEPLQYTVNGRHLMLDAIEAVRSDPALLHNRGVGLSSLGPSVGVALGLINFDASNLLGGTRVGSGSQYAAGPAARNQATIDLTAERPVVGGPSGFGGEQGRTGSALDHAGPGFGGGRPDPWAGAPAPAAEQYGQQAQDPYVRNESSFAGPRDLGDTHNLRRVPRQLERSREPRDTPGGMGQGGRSRDGGPNHGGPGESLAGIEAFAHPEENSRGRGFHVSDFVLGALGMLAVMLIVALLVL